MEHSVKIEKIISNGMGLARDNGRVIMMRHVIPGEIVQYRPIVSKKNYIIAEADVRLASPDRIKPQCPYFSDCGGCDFQHIRYSRQLEIKEEMLKDIFMRNASHSLKSGIDVFASKSRGYRNNIRLTAGNGKLGFLKKKSNEIIDIDSCMIADSDLNDLIPAIKESNEFIKLIDYMVLRKSLGGEILAAVKIKDEFPKNEILSPLLSEDIDSIIIIDKNNRPTVVRGRHELTDMFNNYIFTYSYKDFMQVNSRILQDIIDYMDSIIEPGRLLADIYSGTGVFSLVFSSKFKKVYSVEGSRSASFYNRKNVKENRTGGVKTVQRFIDNSFKLPGEYIDTVIIDPPRSGPAEEFIRSLTERDIGNIFYISCDPAILARDFKTILKKRFDIERIGLFDMFPQTRHFESVAVLKKR
ncbi:MAG: 23S rRNA (uracil(1939)-C(5))-methyltransferase RlmD [candidate division WOR-3 bacterium]|nr:23S rRNA (uracil(1939)-C(5))-methyltransferase RlmD [candidate division WOR-3 bacterium]